MMLFKNSTQQKIDKLNYLLVGSPNVGKSTFFNKVTWKVSPVANIDRLTTFVYAANLRRNQNISVVDLPGINSFNAIGDDEKQSFDYLINKPYDGVINIASATSLKRDLFLTYELAEAGVLSYLVINMMDELKDYEIKKLSLTKTFKVPISLISSKKNSCINEVLYSLNAGKLPCKQVNIQYHKKVEQVIEKCLNLIPNTKISKRFIILQAICKNISIIEYLKKQGVYYQIEEIFHKAKINQDDVDMIIDKKISLINKIINEVYCAIKRSDDSNSQKLDWKQKCQIFTNKLFLNPWFAIPIFILILFLIYFLTFYEYGGGYIQAQLASGLEQLQSIINNSITSLSSSPTQQWWASFVSDGMLGGIFTIIGFIPWIIILVVLISIIEQVGLLSRISIVLDKSFDKFGLSGRSIVNLITGIGCNVPAILLARNANSIKEKVVAIFISPFIACSARVVIFGFIGEAISSNGLSWLLIVGMMIVSVLFTLFVGYTFSNIWFRKSNTLFISEIPPFRRPDFLTILKKVGRECFDFIKRTIIFVGIANMIIWLLNYTSPHTIWIDPSAGTISNQSFLYYISFPFKYILYPLGLGNDWRFSISLISGFPAKEIIASNIETLFGSSSEFINSLAQTTNAVYGTLFAFLVFLSFYIPCFATVSIMKKEIGWKYVLIHIALSLLFSYIFGLMTFSFIGAIELMTKLPVHQISNIIALFSFVVIAFLMILYLKFNKYILFKINWIWTKTHKRMFYTTKYLLITFMLALIIALDVLILLN